MKISNLFFVVYFFSYGLMAMEGQENDLNSVLKVHTIDLELAQTTKNISVLERKRTQIKNLKASPNFNNLINDEINTESLFCQENLLTLSINLNKSHKERLKKEKEQIRDNMNYGKIEETD